MTNWEKLRQTPSEKDLAEFLNKHITMEGVPADAKRWIQWLREETEE